MITHWFPIDGKLQGRVHYAVCGQMIDVRYHSETPSCPECQRLKAERDRDLEQFAVEAGIRFADDPRRI